MKDFIQSSDWPKGRVYDVDTQEQWATAIPMLLEKERERIGMKRVPFLNMGHMSLFVCLFGFNDAPTLMGH